MAKPSPKQWQGWIEAARRANKQLNDTEWSTNVNYRMQKPFSASDDLGVDRDRVAVPEDWARTRQKTAQIASRVPKVVATPKRPQWAKASPVVTAGVNEFLDRAGFSYTLDENLADVINAAGIMACLVRPDVRDVMTEQEVERPSLGVDVMTGEPIPDPRGPLTEKVPVVVYKGFAIDRISPPALLRPDEFLGSNWDLAPWLGYDAWQTEAEIRRQWGAKIPKDWKGSTSGPMLMSKDVRQRATGRMESTGDGTEMPEDTVKYGRVSTVFYRTSCFVEKEPHPHAFSRIVFIEGIDEPVEDGPLDWQEWVDEQPERQEVDPQSGEPITIPAVPGHFLGIKRHPIRVCTLTYISDLATPPSDSQAARPQVREMTVSRSQMIRQRDHSLPLRWYDVNRIDEITVARIQAGEWIDMIPINGPGERVIGEVARANYPRESFQFANIISGDLDRTWSMSNTQLGTLNDTERSATEVQTTANSNAVRLDYEKDKVGQYVAEVGSVLFSLMQLYLDETDYVTIVGPDGKDRLAEINAQKIAGDFAFTFKADSSDRVDIVTKQNSLLKLYNLAGNSPSMNREAIEAELIETFGYDPAKFQVKPPEKGPDPPKISYSFKGEDLLNPMAVAVMLKAGHDIGPDDIKAAAMMIKDSVAALGGLQMQGQTTGQPPAPTEAQGPPPVEPPPLNEPILKRGASGERFV